LWETAEIVGFYACFRLYYRPASTNFFSLWWSQHHPTTIYSVFVALSKGFQFGTFFQLDYPKGSLFRSAAILAAGRAGQIEAGCEKNSAL
jgi:hypothetical protein